MERCVDSVVAERCHGNHYSVRLVLMRFPRSLFVLVAAVWATVAYGQSGYEPVLVPISADMPVAGALGSVWQTEFSLLAVNNEVELAPTVDCFACPPAIHVRPGFALHITGGGLPGDPSGALLYPSRATIENAWFSLRVRDLSRNAQDWGTELPVVREKDFLSDHAVLVDVPLDARFRQALRIYDVDDDPNTTFRVTFYRATDGTVVTQRDMHVIGAVVAVPGRPRVPSVAEVTDLRSAIPELSTENELHIGIVPLTPNVRFWAFVSLTNNTTQHVTTITPQH